MSTIFFFFNFSRNFFADRRLRRLYRIFSALKKLCLYCLLPVVSSRTVRRGWKGEQNLSLSWMFQNWNIWNKGGFFAAHLMVISIAVHIFNIITWNMDSAELFGSQRKKSSLQQNSDSSYIKPKWILQAETKVNNRNVYQPWATGLYIWGFKFGHWAEKEFLQNSFAALWLINQSGN